VTGPEHYLEAERILGSDDGDILEAQVHATLALAAATALGLSARDGMRMGDADAWEEACSVVAGRGLITAAEEP
jgi:hypothetical protein